MKARMFAPLSIILLISLLMPVGTRFTAAAQRQSAVPVSSDLLEAEESILALDQFQVSTALQKTPQMFIENVGQFADGARFQMRGDRTIWLSEDAVWVTIMEQDTSQEAGQAGRIASLYPHSSMLQSRRAVNIELSFVGANPHPRLEPFNRLDTQISYFIGGNPNQWLVDVPVWAGVRYVDIYPGLDLEIMGGDSWSWRVVVKEESIDLGAVRLQVDGAERLILNGCTDSSEQPSIEVVTVLGKSVLPLLGIGGFPVAAQDAELSVMDNVIIAPFATQTAASPNAPMGTADAPADLLYATFLGGSDGESGSAVAVDGSGNVYITGGTGSSDFPAASGPGYDTSYNGYSDAYVVKLNPSGTGLLYATFLGGSGSDFGSAIAVDGSGNVYISGSTQSSDFPAAAGPGYDTSFNDGVSDVFVAKLNPGGTELVYATFLGGSGNESESAIAVDGSGNVYITGETDSSNFPAVNGPGYDTSYNGCRDAFVVKLNPSGTGLLYATFLGGSGGCWYGGDYGYDIAVDGSGNAYVTGVTPSFDFPAVSGPGYDTSHNGDRDAFVVKLNPSGTGLVYATFLGGYSQDHAEDISVDGSGNVYITGWTASSDFPAVYGPGYDTSLDGWDAYVVKLNPDGTELVYATFLGGSGGEYGYDIAVDGSGNAYVTGETGSSDFPAASGPGYDTSYNGGYTDAYVVKLSPSGTSLTYATFLGGDSADYGYGIAVDGSGNVYITGYTQSSNFPAVNGPGYDTSYNGGSTDAFVVKLATAGTAHLIDLSIDSVLPVQVLEGQNLVEGKETAVKVVIRKSGTGPVFNVSVRLDYGSSSRARFYVAEPSNTNAQYSLVADNTSYPLDFAASETTKTIYFFGDSLTPTGSTFQVSVTVDYLGEINETDETNNTNASSSVAVHDTRWSGWFFPDLYLHYFRTDWGATSLPEFDSFYKASNDFFEGVYPVSEQRFTPDRSSVYVGDTTLFRGLDGKLSPREISLWMGWADWRVRLAHPTADKLIATVPSGWFAQTTTDQTKSVGVSHPNVDLVIAEALTAPQPNGMNVAAHEIGHKYGLPYGLPPNCGEEYEACNPFRQEDVGNYASLGLWVSKRIPIQVSTTRRVYCFMGAYKQNTQYWVDATDYAWLLSDHEATFTAGVGTPAATTEAILAVGMADIAGSVTLDNWYALPEAQLSTLVPGPYAFEYQDANGGVLYQQNFDISFTLEGGHILTQSPFVFTIPYVPDTARIVVRHNDAPLAEKIVSPNAPVVDVIEPNGGERFRDQATIRWSGSDDDDDTLYYAVLLSLDNGVTWETVATDLDVTNYIWDFSTLPAGTKNLIKVIATDGVNTGQDVSDAPFVIMGNIYLPLTLRND